uniref:MLO-like protein n=1 Tax=Salix viminalis TaxID=40686 RepID=A0A6N2KYM4_SALVM
MAEGEITLEQTPTWAVATVCFFLIFISIFIEYLLHLLAKYFNKKRRTYLIQALSKIKTELMLLGFVSLLMTVLEKPVAKICIPKSAGETFLPCGSVDSSDWDEEETKCSEQGKASLLSTEGMTQLRYLIFVLASFHSVLSILTFGLRDGQDEKMGILGGRDKDTGLSIFNGRFQLTHQTLFGKRHLRYWNENSALRWPAHFDQDNNFDFHKFIRRALDKDFGVVVGISFWIWMFAVSFIFFNAQKFYNYYWLPFIPLVMLLLVGTKLQAIITLMCLDSHDKSHVVKGTLLVRPSDHLFWFGRPKLPLQLLQFISFQNSFQLAFFTWTWYKFGFRSCFHRRTEDIVIRLVMGVVVHFLCGYVTLPLYALVTQMGTSMRPAVFTEDTRIIHWKMIAPLPEEAEDIAEQRQELQKRSSFEGFDVSNAAHPIVRWDDMEANRHSRVSPWEVEPSGPGPVSSSNTFMAPGLKRSRSGLPSLKAEFPIPDGIGASDFRESSRFQEVLQGQEIMSFNTLYDDVDGQNQHPSEVRSWFPGSRGSGIAVIGSGIRGSIPTSENSYKGIGFNESYRFHKVLQGQEIFPLSPYRRNPNANEARENCRPGLSDGVQRQSSRNGWSTMMQGYNTQMRPPTQVSSPSSVLRSKELTLKFLFCGPETHGGKFKLSSHSDPGLRGERQCSANPYFLSHEHLQHGISQPGVAQSAFRSGQDLVSCKSNCRLFGFSLIEDRHAVNKEDNMTSMTSPLNPESSFLPRVGEQLHPKPPAINNAVGSSCTKKHSDSTENPVSHKRRREREYAVRGDMAEGEITLEETPTWAVATVCFFLIFISIFIEYLLHLLAKYFNKKRRKYLIQALYKIKTELMLLGFVSLLMTVLETPIAKICIPKSAGETFLPCGSVDSSDWSEEETKCSEQGKASLLSTEGMTELRYLIFVLASFHSVLSILTFGLGMAKMRRWESWEAETRTLDYQFSTDPRRFQLTHQTLFGKRHLRCWNENSALRWPAHFDQDNNFDFHKFIRRALDKDFGVVVGMSFWIWMSAVSFIFFNAQKFYSYYWVPFIPLVMLLLVGTKLQAIITLMCLDSHDKSHVVEGTLLVRPSDQLFWFGRPKLPLQLLQFISFQNSFQLAFFTWTWYKFGFRSCFHRRTADIVIRVVMGVVVHFLCGYVTLPLYALVNQMGTSMRTAVFTEDVIEGLKRWRAKARKNLKKSCPARPSLNTSLSLESSPSFSLHSIPESSVGK